MKLREAEIFKKQQWIFTHFVKVGLSSFLITMKLHGICKQLFKGTLGLKLLNIYHLPDLFYSKHVLIFALSLTAIFQIIQSIRMGM